jgi:hypothetical protein
VVAQWLLTMAFWAETRPRKALNAIREVFMIDILLFVCNRSLNYLFSS